MYKYVPSLKLHMGFGNNCMSIRQKKFASETYACCGCNYSPITDLNLTYPFLGWKGKPWARSHGQAQSEWPNCRH